MSNNSQATPFASDQAPLRAFGQNPFDFLIPDRDSTPAQSWRWATVYQADPLRIRLDGDNEPLTATPVDMGGPRTNGDRVYAQIVGRRVVVFGPNGTTRGGSGGWVNLPMSGGSTGSGVTSVSGAIRRVGDLASIYIVFNTAIDSVPTSGNITNLSIYRVPIPYRPAHTQALGSGGTGRGASGAIDSGGLISMAALVTSSTQSGAQDYGATGYSLGGTYML